VRKFFRGCEPEINELVQGRVVDKVFIDDSGAFNTELIIQFSDGDEFVIEYDWIYGWDVRRDEDE
jgi:hypothetical protein